MIKIIVSVSLMIVSLQVLAQTKTKLSLEISYGMQGNFFVRGYQEFGRPDGAAFLKKNFIGSMSGVELKYQATKMASWILGYNYSQNLNKINYNVFINGVGISVLDFDIKHENRFYQLFYQRSLSKKVKNFKYEIGLFYLRSQQQEISIGNNADFRQRNFQNSRLEEGGLAVGLQYSVKIDTKFHLGIRSRLYYLASTNTLETITLTPTLTYFF